MDLHINKSILKNILFSIALTFISNNVSAHNPNTASVVISPLNNVWVAQFTISQEGANYALYNYYTGKDLKSLSEKEYKELYIDYIKKKIALVVDDQKIELSSGGIKLGNHQTDIKFLIPDFPKEYHYVNLKLSIFDENREQNTVVKFVEQDKSYRKILNHSNKFKMCFENNITEFIGIDDNETNYTKPLYFVILLF